MLFLQHFAGYQIAIAQSHHKTRAAHGCEPLQVPIEGFGHAHQIALLRLQHLRHTQLLLASTPYIAETAMQGGLYVESTVLRRFRRT